MDEIALRAFEERDLPFLDRLCTDPDALGVFEWPGFIDPRARRKRWEKDAYVSAESTALAVVVPDGTVVGLASWRQGDYGGPAGVCYEIGLVLLPEHRGKGLGTATQRAVVDHLFRITPVHRIEARTDSENLAEQKVLEKLGFRREGMLRGCFFQHGRYRDTIVYAMLRDEI